MKKNFWWMVILVLSVSFSAQAGFWNDLQEAFQKASPSKEGKEVSSSRQEIAKGLKEALILALQRAVKEASRPGGFLNNPEIRIPPPPKIAKATSFFERLGLGPQVKEFEESMNHAAEEATKEAWPIFVKAAKGLTLEDVNRLYHGGDQAITDYFRQKTWPELYEKFLPVVRENLQKVGVTKYYQELTAKVPFKNYLSEKNLALDHYVAEKALAGLFLLLGEEEKRIRHDPAARTTELLKKIFGR